MINFERFQRRIRKTSKQINRSLIECCCLKHLQQANRCVVTLLTVAVDLAKQTQQVAVVTHGAKPASCSNQVLINRHHFRDFLPKKTGIGYLSHFVFESKTAAA